MESPSRETYGQIQDEHYPYEYPERTILAKDVLPNIQDLLGTRQTAVGRLLATRKHANVTFSDLEDPTGLLQIVLQDPEEYGAYSMGDIVAVEGVIDVPNRGQASLFANDITVLSKTLVPIRKHQLSADYESAHRFLDLLTHRDRREIIVVRSNIVRATRNILESLGLLEMETPVVNTFYNGGVAKPFKTHINSLNRDAFLRVTSELYLKQLVTCGIDGVYEITKQFRNEGLGPIYNPEFTVCEAYCAYKDDAWVMNTVEEIAHTARVIAAQKMPAERLDSRVDISKPWEQISMFDVVCRAMRLRGIMLKNESDVTKVASRDFAYSGEFDGALQLLFKRVAEPTLQDPTFVTDLPESLTPMAKRNKEDDSKVKKVMFYAGGIQMGDGCYEENNPRRQFENFEKQYARHASNGISVYPRDPDFMPAIDRAIPPMAGIAIGFDRMIMLATNSKHIKDVIAFRQKK